MSVRKLRKFLVKQTTSSKIATIMTGFKTKIPIGQSANFGNLASHPIIMKISRKLSISSKKEWHMSVHLLIFHRKTPNNGKTFISIGSSSTRICIQGIVNMSGSTLQRMRDRCNIMRAINSRLSNRCRHAMQICKDRALEISCHRCQQANSRSLVKWHLVRCLKLTKHRSNSR